MEVARVVVFVFQRVDALTKPRVRVVLVEGDTRAEDVNEGEAWMLDTGLVELHQLLRLAAEPAGDVAAAGGERERHRIQHPLEIAVGRRLGLHAGLGRGRCLTGCQPVDLIVHHDIRHVDVPTHRLDEVVESDAVAIAVATGDDHRHRLVGELGAGRKRQRSPVQTVHAVRTNEAGQVRRASDARDDQ